MTRKVAVSFLNASPSFDSTHSWYLPAAEQLCKGGGEVTAPCRRMLCGSHIPGHPFQESVHVIHIILNEKEAFPLKWVAEVGEQDETPSSMCLKKKSNSVAPDTFKTYSIPSFGIMVVLPPLRLGSRHLKSTQKVWGSWDTPGWKGLSD